MISGIPFDGPIGGVRLAYTQEGTWLPHPTYEEGDDATFEIVVAGRENADGDIAIMMVEAGGTERAWEYYQAGAPKVTEAVIAEGLEASKTWIREAIELQRKLVAEAGVAPGHAVRRRRPTTATTCSPASAKSAPTDRQGQHDRRQDRAQRRQRRGAATRSSSSSPASSKAARRKSRRRFVR